MARTQLFARLRELCAHSTTPRAAEAEQALTRRAFVEQVLLGLGVVATGASAGCDGDGNGSASPPKPEADAGNDGAHDGGESEDAGVVVVGGGMAGLMCTHLLEAAGLKVTLFEASKRLGGRMYTVREGFPDAQVAELGGEFIDSDHLTMHMLAEKYGIALDDRQGLLKADTVLDTWWVNGKAVPDATIVEQFKQVAPKMYALMQQADDEEDDSVFVMLDKTSMQAWLDDNLKAQPELKSVLENAYRGEYGRELDEQSVLNLIYLVGSDDPDPFRIFGPSDERYHAHTGSMTFPEKVAGELKGAVELEHRLVKVAGKAGAYRLVFATGTHTREVLASQVVFALPFTLLRKVDLTELTLSDFKRRIIAELGYGTNAKVMGAFEKRVWLTEHNASGSVTADEPFQQCWDTSLGQPGKSGLLTNFLGGKQGEKSGQGSAEDWYTSVLVAGADTVFPGAKAAYVKDTAVRMHWPTQPFTLGSYACYAPGQWEFYGYEGEPEGDNTLHFCGEHTSLDFQGYMEGAAETGALVANAIIEQLGKKLPPLLSALMHVKRALPQPALGERARATRHGERVKVRARALHSAAARAARTR